jgi:AcrR family transcriptional regulator
MTARKRSDSSDPPPKFKAGAELRGRIVDAAAHLFAEKGYEQVSLRRIAEVVGCSQMAMYRHFPDKDALIRHLCDELYTRFTSDLQNRLTRIPDPGVRIEEVVAQFVEFAIRNPNHYRLIFVTPYPSDDTRQARESIAAGSIDYLRQSLRQILPSDAASEEIETRLHQILACMHGMTVMMIAHPRTYGLTRKAAIRESRALVRLIYSRPR